VTDTLNLAALNAMDRDAFVAALGGVFEHSPWIAEAAWPKRPFADVASLHRAMVATVEEAGREPQLALIRAHPELGAGRIAADFSRREQAAAGLAVEAESERERLRGLNLGYRERFGFPFILAVKGLGPAEIRAALERRLGNAPDEEFRAALAEIGKIARFRLDAILNDEAQPGAHEFVGMGETLLAWADRLAVFSEEEGALTRTFLTARHREAAEQVLAWMRAAGLDARMDAIGNVVGRYEGLSPNAPALLFGSHLDTVRNAGRYDGMLGVLTAIACVGVLHEKGERLPFAIEIFGFGDEEGVRFQSTLLGSRAVAGIFDETALDRTDADGITLRQGLSAFGLDPSRIGDAARPPASVLGYVELHIEQGPVLEAEDLPVGVVTSIAGVTRGTFEITGQAGHAGTVPMGLRHDALVAAAEIMLAIEARARGNAALVATVGQIEAKPGAVNVIPGKARFSLDLRSPDDPTRLSAHADILAAAQAVAGKRGVGIHFDRSFESPAVACSPWLMDELERAVARLGLPCRRLPSGAGHDAMAMAALTDIGMIFVRCKGGISHHPDESITAADAETGARVLLKFMRDFRLRDRTGIAE
jgi:OHCU decarboxylase